MDDQRYSRQLRFGPIGRDGQERLGRARVAVVGCGALGSVVAEQLCRAGVGALRLIDRDFIEPSNLQRQSLYTESDAAQALPKAVAAAARLGAINSACRCEPVVADLRAANVERLVAGCDLVLDGTDNFPARHLLNEACCKARTPWIYGACVGAYGLSFPILPGETPCLRCVQDELPLAGDSPTCDTVGVVAPVVHLVAAWQVAEALKILCGRLAAVRRELWASDLWLGTFQRLALAGWRVERCLACGAEASFPLLTAGDDAAVVLCGRDAVQIRRPAVDLLTLAERLAPQRLVANEHLVRWRDAGITATCFRDGRVIVQGVCDAAGARAFCDRWLG
jgi:molybdopterin/thiamine biosynthesis adenylyltransferase